MRVGFGIGILIEEVWRLRLAGGSGGIVTRRGIESLGLS